MKKILLFLMVTLFMTITSFSQTLDQSNAPSGDATVNAEISAYENAGQSFTAGITGNLTQLNIKTGNTTDGGDFQLRIFSGNGYSGTLLSTTTFSISTTGAVASTYKEVVINLSGSTPVISGNIYTFDLRSSTSFVYAQVQNPDYANGGFYLNQSNAFYNDYDLWFKTFVTQTPATHLNFDGVDDHVFIDTGSATNLPTANESYTIEAWIRPTVIAPAGLIGFGEGSAGIENSFEITNIGITNLWNSSNQLNLNYTFIANTWYHVAATYNETTNSRSIYVNGTFLGSDNPTGGYNDYVSHIEIGSNSIVNFNGSMDEVRIWNVARTVNQINSSKNCELQGNETGLVAYFRFNQGVDAANNMTETTLINTVSGGANGTLVNMARTGATSNWLAGSPVTTGSIVPSNATVTTPVTYTQGATATALTATTGTNGTGLLWYTTVTGGTGTTTAPTPSTVNPGNTSYWVSSTNVNGCESTRTQIVVTINASAAAGCWAKISAGTFHTAAIAQNGTLWSWGFNIDGQLGLGDNTERNIPTQVGTATNWQSIEAVKYHILAIKTDGTLWSWGNNAEPDLGLSNSVGTNAPTQVGTDSNWQSISAGEYHTLAIKTNGTLWSWWVNMFGQLGLGDTTFRNTPTQVGSATNWQSIEAQESHSLAIKTDGTLWSWGSNTYGELGLGDTTHRNIPTQIGTTTNWQSVASGKYHTLTIKTDGTLWSWGYNNYGQLGLGDTAPRNTPTQVGTATNWQSVTAGINYNLAIKTDGTLWSWGLNSSGQLGLGDSMQRNAPTQVGSATNWQSIEAQELHSLAIKTDGTISSWGFNIFGQLGLSDTANRNIPTAVACPAVLGNESFEIAANIKMYPNPTTSFVTIEVAQLTNAKLQVYDITGKVLMNQALNTNANSVNVQQLPAGLYLFKVTSNEGTATSKIIKN